MNDLNNTFYQEEKKALEELQNDYINKTTIQNNDGIEEKPNYIGRYLQIKNKKLIALIKSINTEELYKSMHPAIREEYRQYAYRKSITRFKKKDDFKVVKDHPTGYSFKISKTQLFIYEVLKQRNLTYDFLFSDFDDYIKPEKLLETKIDNNLTEIETPPKEEGIPEILQLLKEMNEKLDTGFSFNTRKKRQNRDMKLFSLWFILDNSKNLTIPEENDQDIFSIFYKNSFLFYLLQFLSASNSAYKRTINTIYIQNKDKRQNNVPFCEVLFALQRLIIELCIPHIKKNTELELVNTILTDYFQINNSGLKDFFYSYDECKKAYELYIQFLDNITITINNEMLLEFSCTGRIKYTSYLSVNIEDLTQFTSNFKEFIELLRSNTRYELSRK